MCSATLCKCFAHKYYFAYHFYHNKWSISILASVWLVDVGVHCSCIDCAPLYLPENFHCAYAYQVYTQSTTQFICMFALAHNNVPAQHWTNNELSERCYYFLSIFLCETMICESAKIINIECVSWCASVLQLHCLFLSQAQHETYSQFAFVPYFAYIHFFFSWKKNP